MKPSLRTFCVVLLLLVFAPLLARLVRSDESESAKSEFSNTQAETSPLLSPAEALKKLRLPQGFEATLFAGEPDVQQPIAMTFDERGRVWVAENYTYAEREVNYDLDYHDRIVILEDTDHDGRADKRKVFWDGGQRLTSVETGHGGVWAMCPPNLLFIPDADGDDMPDGPPTAMLDGWDDGASRHNFVNGLRWGPDGWLYGRNGILSVSSVGVPGCAENERIDMNCGIWRFHPSTQKFEVVCHGTTNPWGHDWDSHGQLFFINTVIGHLWQGIPGSHVQRMFGEDLNPWTYELIEQTADHVHWDVENENWSDVRKTGVTETSNRLGGGHAHSGLLIYQGDNWPAKYRGELFTINLHGRRVNRDHLHREGATYVGHHRPDFLFSDDVWFRGLDLRTGPNGGVYLIDWSDIGECHENDGIHRTSGRIYKITHGKPEKPEIGDLSKLSALELVDLQRHPNDWYARQSRRLLQQQAAEEKDLAAAIQKLRTLYDSDDNVTHKLRAMWCLHVMGAADPQWVFAQLNDDNEHIRTWAVRLLVDAGQPSEEAAAAMLKTAKGEQSGLVLTYLASALQRIPHEQRWPLAAELIKHGEFAEDRILPLMVWYGLEPAVAQQPSRSASLVAASRMTRVSRLIARRVSSKLDESPQGADGLVALAAKTKDMAQRKAILSGMTEGLRGWIRAPQPTGWQSLVAAVSRSDDKGQQQLVTELSVVFGDGRAVDDLKQIITDGSQPADSRRRAIRALADARAAGLSELLVKLLSDRNMAADAARALAADGSPEMTTLLLQQYPRMYQAGRIAVIEALATRPQSAQRLLDAVADGTVQRRNVDAFVLRQIQLLGREDLAAKVTELWPQQRLIAGDKLKLIAARREKLSSDVLASANASHGKELFKKSCGKCHKLFGEGEKLAPELTGAQRTNLNYWLENILDPSAVVALNFRMSIVVLKDGRVLNGVLGAPTGRTVTLLTPKEKLTLDRSTIEQVSQSKLSLMPDGLLNELSDEDVRDLFAYLMSPGPIKAAAAGDTTSSSGEGDASP